MFSTLMTIVRGETARTRERIENQNAVVILEQKIREAETSHDRAKRALARLILKARNEAFLRRRNLVLDAVAGAEGLVAPTPEGAFYVFADCAGAMGKTTPDGSEIRNDTDFCAALLDAEAVAVVPGIAFGLEPGFRISYATDDESLIEAGKRIQRFCASLG